AAPAPVRGAAAAGSGALAVEVFRHPRDLPPDVVALFEAAARGASVELGLEWHALLVDHVFEATNEVRFFVLRRSGAAVAALPMRRAHDDPRRAHSLSNYYTALYAPAFQDGVDAAELVPLLRAVRREWRGAAVFDFEPLDPASREYGLLEAALKRARIVPFRYFRFGNWYLPSCGLESGPYLAAREGSVRSTIKRMGKKFAAQGGRLEVITGGERVQAGIAAYEKVYASSWKIPEPYPEFVRGLVRCGAAQGWLRLGVAWLGEEPIAAQIWITAFGRAEIFKLAYDEAHKALSAGTLLTTLLMTKALDEDRVHEVDYLIGDDPYKRAWMSERRERWGLVAYSAASPAGLFGLAREGLQRTLKKIAALRVFSRFARVPENVSAQAGATPH
ncbi:MAG: GNAT family N-acetyltransferase, partial [Burkholderiales bacterium]|nr:GNAT family N-acetyltransferase [Burkholderiales bacterium]